MASDTHQSVSEGGAAVVARCQLPETLPLWRQPPDGDEAKVWAALHPFFAQRGYKLWKNDCHFVYSPDVEVVSPDNDVSNGFAYATLFRRDSETEPGTVLHIFQFMSMNGLCRPARVKDGRDVVIRVLAVGQRGRDHIHILRHIARGAHAFYNSNHTIPLFETVDFEDITFGIFPKVGFGLVDAYGGWAQNSVGDIIDMLRQCLEALTFLQAAGVAHRDAFRDNFLIQWHPESLLAGHSPHSMPRVYLTDFEVAVQFPEDATFEDCVVSGIPSGGSFPDDVTQYKRPVPPEVTSGSAYNAFKMDVWQLGKSYEDFQSTIPKIDELLEAMRDPESERRPDSTYALSYLAEVLSSIPPKSLLIPPVILPSPYDHLVPKSVLDMPVSG
ncbi:hypothetical protein BN946_scf184895.g6 [Trametes cinnabarina]|uniref:Protein kinase domain-containing protein n=1 Tax=Pycnoporus cinnabarinus TaxID=5643 RepID=A0A060SM15_PYCCI|nr:hypothetical protein BN946_scf184895.g6 [Trametes cinnabarina]